MKLEEIMIEVEKALAIDETNLARESLETPKIYGNILRIRTNESMILHKHKHALKQLYADKRDYYLGRADPAVYKEKPFNLKILKSEVDHYVDADGDIGELKLKIEFLDSALKQIANRGFCIKNAIDFQKLMSGGY